MIDRSVYIVYNITTSTKLFTFTNQNSEKKEMRILLVMICWPFTLFCQNTIGFPEVINYTNNVYNAGLQNWDIGQDKNGIMYFANNEGLLSFDGINWTLYPLPNKTVVRSVEVGKDNRIYVGGQDELGYFMPSSNGRLQYYSLTNLIPAKDKSFGDVWDIVSLNNSLFFRSANKIFQLSNGSIHGFNAPFEWSFMGMSNNKLYAHDLNDGLFLFENNKWNPVGSKNELPSNDPVTSILSFTNDKAILTTLKNGMFNLSKDGITPASSVNNSTFKSDRIYAATVINQERMALATNTRGVYITDLSGSITQSFSKAEHLQDNNVLSIFYDAQGNLWLGLNNGIDFIAYNSAIKHIRPLLQDGPGYTAIVHNNQLYTGTSNGVFAVKFQLLQDLSFSKGNFIPVAGTNGQSWSLAEINNILLLGHHEGAFEIKGETAQKISSQPGFWNFAGLSNLLSNTIVAGNYKGLLFFDYANGNFKQTGQVPGFNESSRFVAIDKKERIWVSHPFHGVHKIIKAPNGNFTVKTYTNKNGLPSLLNNHVYKIINDVVVATEKGIYVYNEVKDLFEPSEFYRELLGDQSIRYLKQDGAGNIWFIHEKQLGVVDRSEKQSKIIYLPELNDKMLSGFEFIYSINQQNILLGGENGFYLINFDKYKKQLPQLNVQIRHVRIIDNNDSLLYGGYAKNLNENNPQEKQNIPEISNNWKTIHFDFSTPLYGMLSNLQYSYYLKEFDNNWSEWSKRAEKEYTNLPAGEYTFQVKVRNNLGNESPVAQYSFVVLPPWYKTVWANLFYFLVAVSIFYYVYRIQHKKFQEQQKKYEKEQRNLLYIHELELNKSESELMMLRNEKMEAEINIKNSELASSAMHLVKKGELLTKIKADLTHTIKRLKDENAIVELRKMIRSLTEDGRVDEEWDNFAKHFDTVNRDFVVHLKEKHPGITSNELKLCAYLRMNLSTKEIAQLMNISVRGVEISRYRLRKKLGITSEVGLFDYLIEIK